MPDIKVAYLLQLFAEGGAGFRTVQILPQPIEVEQLRILFADLRGEIQQHLVPSCVAALHHRRNADAVVDGLARRVAHLYRCRIHPQRAADRLQRIVETVPARDQSPIRVRNCNRRTYLTADLAMKAFLCHCEGETDGVGVLPTLRGRAALRAVGGTARSA